MQVLAADEEMHPISEKIRLFLKKKEEEKQGGYRSEVTHRSLSLAYTLSKFQ